MIFTNGVCHFLVSTSTHSGISDEKVGECFSEFLCLMEVSKIRF